ncbi:MAG: HEAT repeat domain-containing protein [Terriglobia bacterium]
MEGLFSECKLASPGGSEYALTKIEYVRFKYQRTIKGVKKAGLERALVWAESSNPTVQMLALRTFEEIADSKSVAEIVKLAHSPKPGVCMAAVNSLAHILHRTPATKEILECESKRP